MSDRSIPALGIRRMARGVGAVGAKDLRGRMRGRRAFVVLTLYLVLLAGFAWMVELIMERTYQTGFGGNAVIAAAAIGQGIFVSLLMLEMLLVAFLAPMATAGSISLEREKQTLEMLAATPITSLSIVIGKLVSALIYVWLLIAASIPLTAVVFVFGGVAPDDLVRGYVILVVTALGLGSFGLFASSLVKRTQAASAITIFGVLALSMGTLFVIVFWQALAASDNGRGAGPIKGAAPAPLIFLNPFLAQADVAPTDALCASDNALRYYCLFRTKFLFEQDGIIFLGDDTGGGGPVPRPVPAAQPGVEPLGPPVADFDVAPPQDVMPFGGTSSGIWESTVIAWLILSAIFLLLSVQFVSPTRRWRLPRRSRPPSGVA